MLDHIDLQPNISVFGDIDWPFAPDGKAPGALRYMALNAPMAYIAAVHLGEGFMVPNQGPYWSRWILSQKTAEDEVLATIMALTDTRNSDEILVPIIENRLFEEQIVALKPWESIRKAVLASTGDPALASLSETAAHLSVEQEWHHNQRYLVGLYDSGKRLAEFAATDPKLVTHGLRSLIEHKGSDSAYIEMIEKKG